MRRRAVLGALLLGALTLATVTTVWVTATTVSPVDPDVPVTVTGGTAAPGAAAGALVVLAAGLALSLGGRWGRVGAAVAVLVGGALVAVSAGAVLADPAAHAASAAQEAVGVAVLTGPATTTPAPWAALLWGVAAVALGGYTALTAGRWGSRPSRHESVAAGSSPHEDVADDQARWDALTRGEDPT